MHEIFFEAAIADAQKLDDYFAQNGKPIGPLHGLPISLKDQFHVKGVETTMGYVGVSNPDSEAFAAFMKLVSLSSIVDWHIRR